MDFDLEFIGIEDFNKQLSQYEEVTDYKLMKSVPVIVKIDGKGFRKLLKADKKSSVFNEECNEAMRSTLVHLCRNVKGCVLGFTISDEINLVLYDTVYWYDYHLQYMVSSIASMATIFFNKSMFSLQKAAFFDVTAFNIPNEAILDYFITKQNFEMRKNLEHAGWRKGISKPESYSDFELKQKLLKDKGYDYNKSIDIINHHGVCCIEDESHNWSIDNKTPIFESNYEYITQYFLPSNETGIKKA